ncbi:2-dehydro-3-deoxygluconokinase [Friedmanniella endophytica]|uniref:2-dehydro-3-deoxygluconokinase n=1 Tax=Microlunatus kandeliicorticis TaxID=1759536 RepID=A0A7W3IT91_9ACTN|nr:sugar kinase [Microlunatus kandeliicorticis]MBA8794793.1 2-dehydro-3-deoxygluconokinase [Microlunatus kandeliicorticis]
MTGDQVRVVTAGETMMLVAPTGPGRLRHAGALSASAGGAESNVAIGLSRLGVCSRWLGAVGDDEPGQLVLHRIRAEGVDTGAVIVDPTRPTALYLREQVAGATRVYYYRRGSAGSALAPGCLDPAVLDGAEVLHLSGITAALSESCAGFVDWLLDQAHQRGLLVSYDVNYRSRLWAPEAARAATEAVLDRVDLLLVGHEEARALWGWDDDTALDRLAERGPAETVLKRGARGCVALIDGVRHEVDGFAVTEVDPIGAGDAFAAGYLAARLAGAEPADRLRTANAMGAFCVQSHGDYEGLPSRAELEAFTDQREDLGR